IPQDVVARQVSKLAGVPRGVNRFRGTPERFSGDCVATRETEHSRSRHSRLRTMDPMPSRSRLARTGLVLALCAAAAFGGFAATALQESLRPAQAKTPDAAQATPAVAPPSALPGTPVPSLAPMLQRVMPAVVSVHSEQRVRVSPFGNDPFFRRMFPELTQERINR